MFDVLSLMFSMSTKTPGRPGARGF